MRILRAADHRRMAWKNGGGETVEIIVSPPAAGLDDFDWRISMARVERDGPFSAFPGIDRTLAVLDGEGLILDVEGRVPLALTARGEPVTFPADAPTTGRLVDGPITDLNVMSRRGRFVHSVEPLQVSEAIELDIVETDTFILCLRGIVGIRAEGMNERLDQADALHWNQPAGVLELSPSGPPATVMMIEFRAGRFAV